MIYIFILVILILAVIIYLMRKNNYRLYTTNNELETYVVENLINMLILYENFLTIDYKGYFRSDDEVGSNFFMLESNIKAYLEILNDRNINIDDNEIVQEKIINVDFLLKKINELEKEERLYQFQMRQKPSNTTKKVYAKQEGN